MFSTNAAERDALIDKLKNYLLDPKNLFVEKSMIDNAKTRNNLSNDEEFFEMRLKEDMTFLNFFFDTQIITQINMEMKVSTFDKLSLIGGTLGLCTGISIITLIEIIWWLIQFGVLVIRQQIWKKENNKVYEGAARNKSYLEPM